MKNFITATFAAALCIFSMSAVKPAITPDPAMEKEIDKILSKMSLEDKVGQMCEITVDVVSDMSTRPNFSFDKSKLEWAIRDAKLRKSGTTLSRRCKTSR
jgi:beta-glucosidase